MRSWGFGNCYQSKKKRMMKNEKRTQQTLSPQFHTVVVVLQVRAVAGRSSLPWRCFVLFSSCALLLSTNKYAHILIISHENYGQIMWSPGGYLLYISIFFVLLLLVSFCFLPFRVLFASFSFSIFVFCFGAGFFLVSAAVCYFDGATRMLSLFFACLHTAQSAISVSSFFVRFRFHFALHCFEERKIAGCAIVPTTSFFSLMNIARHSSIPSRLVHAARQVYVCVCSNKTFNAINRNSDLKKSETNEQSFESSVGRKGTAVELQLQLYGTHCLRTGVHGIQQI